RIEEAAAGIQARRINIRAATKGALIRPDGEKDISTKSDCRGLLVLPGRTNGRVTRQNPKRCKYGGASERERDWRKSQPKQEKISIHMRRLRWGLRTDAFY